MKRHNEHRIASESLDAVISSAYPVGWVIGDMKDKHPGIIEQYIYASVFSVKMPDGKLDTYIAQIALDGKGTPNVGVFKDILVEKIGSGTYAGCGANTINRAYRRTLPVSNVNNVISKIKNNCQKKYGKYFLDSIPEDISQQRDILFERAVNENLPYALGMLKRFAIRNGISTNGKSFEIRYDQNGKLIPLSERILNNGKFHFSVEEDAA